MSSHSEDNPVVPPAEPAAGAAPALFTDGHYFASYGHLQIHEDMLRDLHRTEAYRVAIERARHVIEGKAVVDIGCGTGILSMFCAEAGARHVYAIDASDIAHAARAVVAENGLADTITVIHGKAEEVTLPEKCDVLVSEWMGYFLLYERMLPSVLVARDRFLRPGGLVLPSRATLYIAPICDEYTPAQHVDFWESVYGFSMRSLQPHARQCSFAAPRVEQVWPECVVARGTAVHSIALGSATPTDVSAFTAPFECTSMIQGDVNAFAVWFDVFFDIPAHGDTPASVVRLGTGPDDPLTHWKQVALFIDTPLHVEQDTVVRGELSVRHNAEHARFLDIGLSWAYSTPHHSGEGEKSFVL